MSRIKRIVIFGLLLVLTIYAKAQQENLIAAQTFLQQGNLDSAKYCIDAAVLNPATENNAQVWYLKGFIYKTIYNKTEKGNKQSPSRLAALSFFKKSLSIDSSQENTQENIKNIKYLATRKINNINRKSLK